MTDPPHQPPHESAEDNGDTPTQAAPLTMTQTLSLRREVEQKSREAADKLASTEKEMTAATELMQEAERRVAEVAEKEESLKTTRDSLLEKQKELKDLRETHKSALAELEKGKVELDQQKQTQRRLTSQNKELRDAAYAEQRTLRKHLASTKKDLSAVQLTLAETQETGERARKRHHRRVEKLKSDLSDRDAEIAELRPLVNELRTLKRRLTRTRNQLEQSEETATTLQSQFDCLGPCRITDENVIRWLASEIEDDLFEMPGDVVMVGDKPIPWNQLYGHLQEWGSQVWNSDCEWVIVGREGWTEEDLERVLKERTNSEIRIVSQELFLAAVVSGHDPFCADEEILLAFAKGHPALQYLLDAGFEWPFLGEELTDEPDLFHARGADCSPLTEMGYHVGVTKGLPEEERHELLTEAYSEPLPWVDSDAYMEQWGSPRSRRRLWRMAHHLAWLIRTRQSLQNHEVAVMEWAEDLDRLQDEYYRPWMRFNWPSSYVG